MPHRLLPRTAAWAGLEAVREAARRVDARVDGDRNLMCALNGAGLAGAIQYVGRRFARTRGDAVMRQARAWGLVPPVVVALLMAAPSIPRAMELKRDAFWEDVSPLVDPPSIWRDDTARLMAMAGERPDLCALAMPSVRSILVTPGFTYLHRDVPLLTGAEAAADWATFSRAANYAILSAGVPPPVPLESVAAIGDSVLFRRPGVCEPLPQGSRPMRRVFSRPKAGREGGYDE